MQQRFEEETSATGGLDQQATGEVLRRAQEIRRRRDNELSREQLEESAAEVGIHAEDLREAESQLAAERQARLARAGRMRWMAVGVGAVLSLTTLGSYNSLNSSRAEVLQRRAEIQSVLQYRADKVDQLVKLAREGTAAEKASLDALGRQADALRSADLGDALSRSRELTGDLSRLSRGGASSQLYQGVMDEVAGSANRLNVAWSRYIQSASRYNQRASSFPHMLLRPVLGMPAGFPLFQAPSAVR